MQRKKAEKNQKNTGGICMAERMISAEEKALLQAKHRLEEAQARDRVRERKQRTRRLIQEGAILESVLPAASAMELDALRGYLEERFGA